ncbi:MAG: cupredoxin domain-containing protein [Nanoarchaeota archaeon]|nr:cupredoxin domain-containing protein [Nanoarchaeota archaeon]
MKLFYGIVLVLMIFVSACAQQAAEQAPVTEPEASAEAEVQPEAGAEGTGTAVAAPEEEVVETTSNEIRSVGAGGFDPDELTISAGSAVTWINDDEKALVIIIFKDGKSFMNSNRIMPGEKFEIEFTEAGEYEYWQNIAFGVVGGKITVE